MIKGPEQIFSKRSQTNCQQVHEKMITIRNLKGKTNWKQIEILPYNYYVFLKKMKGKCCGDKEAPIK